MELDSKIVRRETARAWDNLPWLTTTNLNPVFAVPDLRKPHVVAALDFISSFNSAQIRKNLKIEKIDIDDDYVLRVSVSNGATVEILNEKFDRQLARWNVVHHTLFTQRESYTWIDLSVSNNVPVHRVSLTDRNTTNFIRHF